MCKKAVSSPAAKGAMLAFLWPAAQEIWDWPLSKSSQFHTVAFSPLKLETVIALLGRTHTQAKAPPDTFFPATPPCACALSLQQASLHCHQGTTLGQLAVTQGHPHPSTQHGLAWQQHPPNLTDPSKPRRMLWLLMSRWTTCLE